MYNNNVYIEGVKYLTPYFLAFVMLITFTVGMIIMINDSRRCVRSHAEDAVIPLVIDTNGTTMWLSTTRDVCDEWR